jgi:predicted enzyme related to lactoylglutathione lyase
MEGKATGIGGIFFKTEDVDETKNWYQKHLGLNTDEYGAVFKFRKEEDPNKTGYLQWSPFPQNSDYFGNESQSFMINYRVSNIENLVEKLKKEGVTICNEISSYDYGKFIHILDHEGRSIELWEPVDEVFDEFYKNKESK